MTVAPDIDPHPIPDLVVGPVTRTTLALFAGASHDHTPLHIDIDFARAAGHNDVFAHGMYVMANMARLLTRWRPQRDLLQLGGRFIEIVRVGDVLTCSGHVREVASVQGERHGKVSISVVRQDGRQVMSGEATVRLTDAENVDGPDV